MINREDMLELTRRMTPARTSFVRMAGCYTDSGGEYDGSFNIHFLKLSGSEKARNLAIAKKILFAESNEKLREYRFPETSQPALLPLCFLFLYRSFVFHTFSQE